jgi:2-polyprenyl-3-methyl-5-hydroxy-6-metoxy-1,4-benzoquinol methylase
MGGEMVVALDPEQAETRVIHELVDFADRDVLEVGCGDGRLTWRYAARARSVLALDPDKDAIGQARAHLPDLLGPRVTFQFADITTAILPPATFDVVIFAWSL